MNNKIKHLEFIQAIITRMNSNAFMIKGWTITLVSALFALTASNSNPAFILIAFIPVLIFWGLDAYFLSQERQYRDLYKDTTAKSENQINFSLNASGYNKGKNNWSACFRSKTILVFYFPLIILMVVIMYFLK